MNTFNAFNEHQGVDYEEKWFELLNKFLAIKGIKKPLVDKLKFDDNHNLWASTIFKQLWSTPKNWYHMKGELGQQSPRDGLVNIRTVGRTLPGLWAWFTASGRVPNFLGQSQPCGFWLVHGGLVAFSAGLQVRVRLVELACCASWHRLKTMKWKQMLVASEKITTVIKCWTNHNDCTMTFFWTTLTLVYC